jgi:hypothetical protein
MNIKLVAGLIAALGFAGASAASTTSVTFSGTGNDAFIDIAGKGLFESVLKVSPSALNSLTLSFSALDGAYSTVKYTFFTDAALSRAVALSNASGYAIRAIATPLSENFSANDKLDPFSDIDKRAFDLAATPYYIRLAGTLNDLDGVGQFKISTGGALVAAVPEPETYAMLLAGLGLMATIARRRNKSGSV